MNCSRLLVVVERPWFSRSPFDSYVKYFADLDGLSAEEHFVRWWTGLPADSFTRTKCNVRVFEIDLDFERKDLMAPWSAGELSS